MLRAVQEAAALPRHIRGDASEGHRSHQRDFGHLARGLRARKGLCAGKDARNGIRSVWSQVECQTLRQLPQRPDRCQAPRRCRACASGHVAGGACPARHHPLRHAGSCTRGQWRRGLGFAHSGCHGGEEYPSRRVDLQRSAHCLSQVVQRRVQRGTRRLRAPRDIGLATLDDHSVYLLKGARLPRGLRQRHAGARDGFRAVRDASRGALLHPIAPRVRQGGL
mmetsp:Transcript_106112/g.298307  ORF Transcript_106112/g.298307 Transcript_106112/m.298307 type:complete len:222 (+) Transcript_106112:957-1622(+)